MKTKHYFILIALLSFIYPVNAQYECEGMHPSEQTYLGYMTKGQSLKQGQALVSYNGYYQLTINTKNELVIESIGSATCDSIRYVSVEETLWNAPKRRTGWGNPPEDYLNFQNDCNVVFGNVNGEYWLVTNGNDANKKILNNCSKLFLTDEGILVLVGNDNKPLWSSSSLEDFPMNDYTFIDRSKMVPLPKHPNYDTNLSFNLVGKAIKKSDDFETTMLLDTGSYEVYVPYHFINPEEITTVDPGIEQPYIIEHVVQKAMPNTTIAVDRVKGQIGLQTIDGTNYVIDNYIFYVFYDKNDKARQLPQNKVWNGTVVGGFPSEGTLISKLAKKYSAEKNVDNGFGFVTLGQNGGIENGWVGSETFLTFGATTEVTKNVHWSKDIKNFRGGTSFYPEAVPGFQVQLSFKGIEEKITSPDMIATIDTGASQLMTRIGETNPQDSKPFSDYFVDDTTYDDSKTVKEDKDVTVKISFTDKEDETVSYSYKAATSPKLQVPNYPHFGTWNGTMPWPVNTNDKPNNRMNIGNSIYYYCPIVFWNIKAKRFGVSK